VFRGIMALSAIHHGRIDNSGFVRHMVLRDRGRREAQKEQVP
jgi:hypothetical protein